MDVADAILRLVDGGAPFGVWHATSQGETTWNGFAREIFTLLGLDPARVQPTTTDQFPRPAPRPAYSVLGHDAWRMARIARLPDWRTSLATALPDVIAPAGEDA
jgi:dTDP-4-dehydrorhamnose reductase